MAGLRCINLKKCYDNNVVAVQGFNLDIKDGEFIVLLGPSGCGKSTALRMIAGLEKITDGELFIGDKLVNTLAPSDRDIAMVFQNYALYGNMTVYENIGFSLTIRHQDTDVIHEKTIKAAEVVELSRVLNNKPANLSGGQRQRVALGRSMVRDAKVFLLDEPLSNLDAKLRNETRRELVKLQRRLGTTFIYVTHDQVEAMTMADRMVIMKDGIIQQIGTPADVYNSPCNMFVAGFIGSPPTNFITGEIKNGSFVSKDLTFPLIEDHKKALSSYENRTVIVGIRPENIRESHVLPVKSNDIISINVKLDVVELLGADMLIHFYLNDKMLTGKVLSSSDFKRDQNVELSVFLRHVHFFDPETTKRIDVGGTLCND
ncbi:MAG: sugar transporter ATP-binding protein [Anaerocolumna sp.]|jgi:multiple sugar transport system ATP-binding protein|nr:sugar transporter ATP-binding protein [Anaerocolumna sp.]